MFRATGRQARLLIDLGLYDLFRPESARHGDLDLKGAVLEMPPREERFRFRLKTSVRRVKKLFASSAMVGGKPKFGSINCSRPAQGALDITRSMLRYPLQHDDCQHGICTDMRFR